MADKGYTTEEKIEAYLGGISITEGDADDYILATQELIDRMTGRNFKADVLASARQYDGNDRRDLIIDDCVEVTKVEVGNSIWPDSFTEQDNDGDTPQYYLMPTNYADEGLPIRKVGLRNKIWTWGHANARITAKWGYSETPPDDLQFAATVIAAGMYYNNRGAKTGAVKQEKIGEYSVSYSDEGGFNDLESADTILESYKKYEI